MSGSRVRSLVEEALLDDPLVDGKVLRILDEYEGSPGAPGDQVRMWERFKAEVLLDEGVNPGYARIPFETHRGLYRAAFADRDADRDGVPEAWTPSPGYIAGTNAGRWMERKGFSSYPEFHRWTAGNREEFWKEFAGELGIDLIEPPARMLEKRPEMQEWVGLPGARMNIVDSCLRSELRDDIAIKFMAPSGGPAQEGRAGTPGGGSTPEGPVGKPGGGPDAVGLGGIPGGELRTITFGELEALVNRVANALAEMGLKPGDLVGMYSSMTVEAVAFYLGAIRAGCIAATVVNTFPPDAIKKRLLFKPLPEHADMGIAPPRVIFTQDFHVPSGKEVPLYEPMKTAVELCREDRPDYEPRMIVATHRGCALRENDVGWEDFLKGADDQIPPVEVRGRNSTDIMAIIFSSGTTGEPKAISWDHTTALKCALDGYFHHDIRPGDTAAWPTDLGWMMGPWLVFAGFLNRASIALYYGFAGNEEFGRFVQEAGITQLGLVPVIIRRWKAKGYMEKYGWSCIRAFSNTGEPSKEEEMFYLMHLARYKPIVEYCGGTEIGGGYITGTVVQPASPSFATTPAVGMRFYLKREDPEDTHGEVFLEGPSMGLSKIGLNFPHDDIYYGHGTTIERDGETRLLRRHGDTIRAVGRDGTTYGGLWEPRTEKFKIMGRADDDFNIGGRKLNAEDVETPVMMHPLVKDAAAVAPHDEGLGRAVLHLFLLLERPLDDIDADALKKEIQDLIAEKLGIGVRYDHVIKVDKIPYTASNKKKRGDIRRLLEKGEKEGDWVFF